MPGNVALAITSLSSGGFALLGVGVSNWMAARRERATFRTETVLELAGMERLVWGEDWVELQAHLQRQEARLAVGGVPDDLVQAFHDISLACWHNLQESIERSAGQEPGIRTQLLDARQLVHRAARAYLLRDEKRSVQAELRREAVTTTRSVLQDSASTSPGT
jgi:hypothetical protein